MYVSVRASNDEFGGSFFLETEKKKTKKKRAFVYEVSDSSCLDTSREVITKNECMCHPIIVDTFQ